MKVSLLQELLTLPEHLDSVPVFSRVRVARFLVFCIVFYRSLFVILASFLLLLYCLYLSRLGRANGRNSVIQWMGLKILPLQIVFSLQGVWYFSILRHVVHLISIRQPAVPLFQKDCTTMINYIYSFWWKHIFFILSVRLSVRNNFYYI